MNNTQKFGLSADTIKKICDIFTKHPGIQKVILYGSRAKGNYRPNSDIDLCVVGETLSLTQLMKIENEIDDLLLPWKIDLSLKHKIDNGALLQHLKNHGIVFFESIPST